MPARAHDPRACAAALFSGRGLELDHQLGGNAAAVLYVNALGLGPLADFGGVQPGRRGSPRRPCWPPGGPAPGPPGRADVGRQCLTQRLGVTGIQVDLVLGAVQPETDCPFGLTSVEVIDEHSLYLLSHGVSFLSPVFW